MKGRGPVVLVVGGAPDRAPHGGGGPAEGDAAPVRGPGVGGGRLGQAAATTAAAAAAASCTSSVPGHRGHRGAGREGRGWSGAARRGGSGCAVACSSAAVLAEGADDVVHVLLGGDLRQDRRVSQDTIVQRILSLK